MDWFNEDMLCWESDFPHSDSNWPFAPEDVIETMGHLDDAMINKITHENAMAAYSFDPFTHIPKEHARAGYLRAQATDVDVVTHVGREASQRDRDAWARMTAFGQARMAEAAAIADRATTLGTLSDDSERGPFGGLQVLEFASRNRGGVLRQDVRRRGRGRGQSRAGRR